MANDDYKVGYKKPPVETQFPPGQSGNPSGRPKGTVRLNDIVTAELNSLIMVMADGTEKPIPKMEAMVKALTAKAMQGDVKAANVILKLAAPAEEEAFRAQREYDMKGVDEAVATAQAVIRRLQARPRCMHCNPPKQEGNNASDVSTQNSNEMAIFPDTGEVQPGLTKWYPPIDPSSPEVEID